MNTSNYSGEVGSNVRAELARRGKTQMSLGKHLNLSAMAVSRRLRGDVPFDVNELETTAKFLNVPMSTLLGTAALADTSKGVSA